MALSTLKASLQAAKNAPTPQTLTTWNRWLAIVHAVQGIVILLLSTTKLIPVHTNYLTLNPISTEVSKQPVLTNAVQHLFDINLAYLLAIIFFAAAVAHGLMATVYRQRYEADLKKGVNVMRWYTFGITGGLTLIVLALLSGVADISLLLALFILLAVCSMAGLIMEVYNQGKATPNWLPYIVKFIAGITPFVVLLITLIASNSYGGGNIPTFIYWLVASMAVCFAGFSAISVLYFKKHGAWKNYAYSERMFLILLLVTNTALAWQVFAGSLRP